MGRFGAFFRQPEGKAMDLVLRGPDRGTLVHLSVNDNGVGMPSGAALEDSNGFGSLLVRSLVDQIHGSMDAESSPGSGPHFGIRFPTVDSDP